MSPDDFDDFCKKLRRSLKAAAAKRGARPDSPRTGHEELVDQLALLPDLFHLAVRLLFDAEIPAEKKAPLIVSVFYVVLPIDLIPDAIPLAGRIDDLLVVACGMARLLDLNDERVMRAVKRHYAGKGDVSTTVRRIIEAAKSAAGFLPANLLGRIAGVFNSRGRRPHSVRRRRS